MIPGVSQFPTRMVNIIVYIYVPNFKFLQCFATLFLHLFKILRWTISHTSLTVGVSQQNLIELTTSEFVVLLVPNNKHTYICVSIFLPIYIIHLFILICS